MNNIAVIGDKMSVFGFRSIGISVFECETKEEAEKNFDELVKSEYSIIYITEPLAEKIADRIEKYRFLPNPAIILIPSISQNTGKGMRDVEISVEKAIGSKII